MIEAALKYASLGYKVFPCRPGEKIPATEHGCKDATTDPATIHAWWKHWPTANVAIHAEGLLVVDIDSKQGGWPETARQIHDLAIAPCARTPRGGSHHYFRDVRGTAKNTIKKIYADVDTRATGGYVMVPPSKFEGKPYKWAGELPRIEDLPPAPGWLYDALEQALKPKPIKIRALGPSMEIGDEEKERRAIAYLDNMPAAVSGQRGHNATYAAATALVHGFCLDPQRAFEILRSAYNPRCQPPWSDSELAHKIESAVRQAHDRPRGWLLAEREIDDVDLSVFTILPAEPKGGGPEEEESGPGRPEPLKPEDLRIPGFVSEVMDYTLATAPYPNRVLAFCGALALQAHLSGRKIRDTGDLRTNLYLLGLAYSGAGKDWPRKVNAQILFKVNQFNSLGESFASAEGVQDALLLTPALLFQTDEIDGLLLSIKSSKDARFERIMSLLLTLYSSASSIYPIRKKAGSDKTEAVDQPCLSIFGTAVPDYYYEALSERMLTNGFFSRFLVFEGGKRERGQDAKVIDPPQRLLETAAYWAKFRSGGPGEFSELYPSPLIVNATEGAVDAFREIRAEADDAYDKAQEEGDRVATTVWSRACEHVRKLALIYAASEDYRAPKVTRAGIAWAAKVVRHQVQGALWQIAQRGGETKWEKDAARLQRFIHDAGGSMAHGRLLKKMKVTSKDFKALITTLTEAGLIGSRVLSSGGRPIKEYILL